MHATMQTLKTLAAWTVLAGALAGCSGGLNQDPYANQPDEVKNAGPMDPKPKEKKGDALSSAYLRIQSEDSYEFREGVETKVTIKGAVLADVNGHEPILGQDYQLTIDNMTDFPGASFDAMSGEFKWTPKPGYVSEEYTRNVHIEATLTTLFQPILQTKKSIVGVITRASIDPTVESVDDLTSAPTKEGETRDFRVWVRDPHASDKSPDTKPRLAIVSDGAGSSSAANLIYCVGTGGCTNPDKDPNDPQRFGFKLRLDLTNKEITKDTTTLSFGVIAISRFGETSAVRSQKVVVKSKLQDPEISWSTADSINVVAGKENLVNFTVYDPGSEGTLTINFDSRCDLVLGPTAVCSCTTQGRPGTSSQLCTISWAVPPQPLQSDYDLTFTTFNRSKDQTQMTQKQFQRRLHVVQAAPPPPSGGGGGPIHTTPAARNGGAQ